MRAWERDAGEIRLGSVVVRVVERVLLVELGGFVSASLSPVAVVLRREDGTQERVLL